MTETEIVTNKDYRDMAIKRIEILDKVKKLFLIPNMEVMTTKMVAEYYEVGYEAIKSLYKDNYDEINSDGVYVEKYKDFSKVLGEPFKIGKGKASYKLSNNVIIDIPTRGTLVFPKRAILRIGMLLRDSNIAKEIRTQLLNVFDLSNDKQKTQDIDEEQKLILNVGVAYASGDFDEFVKANIKLNAFKNRHINNLETENTILAKATLKWDRHMILNALVRSLSVNCFHGNFGRAWNAFYRQFNYKLRTNIKDRKIKKSQTYVDAIKDNEWEDALSIAAGLCKNNNLDVGEIINSINIESIK